MANWDDQGKQYAAFIEAQLAAETDRRNSVNSRAATTLTGATGLVTLALAAFVIFVGKDPVLSGPAKFCLAVALVALFFAAVSAVLAGLPWTSSATSPETMRSFLRDTNLRGSQGWNNSEVTARNFTAQCNLRAIEVLRPGTKKKFIALIIANVFQILAVVFLVACTLFVVNAHPTEPAKSSQTPPPCCSSSSSATLPPASVAPSQNP